MRGPILVGGTARRVLPVPLTSFVGREAELARVAELLAGTRLLTLTGAGGGGKTRLALETARATAPYPDGVWFVELAPLAHPHLLPGAAAAALRVPEESGEVFLATLASAIGSRRTLLVLDNCEHLVDACAHLADALLRACPRLTILATSREPLNVAGETTWHVPSLALDDPGGAPPDARAPSEAVRLFVDRARAVRPDFVLTAAAAPVVAQICRFDGLPLAIELAAARSRLLAPEEIAARLDDRFRLLVGGNRAARPRHQTLRALVDWSYDLLSPGALPPDRGSPSSPATGSSGAVAAVCATPPLGPADLLDLLGALVGKSLVVAEEQPDGTIRFRLLETVRYYAAEKLDDADRRLTFPWTPSAASSSSSRNEGINDDRFGHDAAPLGGGHHPPHRRDVPLDADP